MPIGYFLGFPVVFLSEGFFHLLFTQNLAQGDYHGHGDWLAEENKPFVFVVTYVAYQFSGGLVDEPNHIITHAQQVGLAGLLLFEHSRILYFLVFGS